MVSVELLHVEISCHEGSKQGRSTPQVVLDSLVPTDTKKTWLHIARHQAKHESQQGTKPTMMINKVCITSVFKSNQRTVLPFFCKGNSQHFTSAFCGREAAALMPLESRKKMHWSFSRTKPAEVRLPVSQWKSAANLVFTNLWGFSWGKIDIEAKHSPEIHLQSPPIVPLKQVLHLVLDSQYRQPSASFLHQAKVASASLKEIALAIRDMTNVLSHISRQTERQQRAPVFGSRKTSNIK